MGAGRRIDRLLAMGGDLVGPLDTVEPPVLVATEGIRVPVRGFGSSRRTSSGTLLFRGHGRPRADRSPLAGLVDVRRRRGQPVAVTEESSATTLHNAASKSLGREEADNADGAPTTGRLGRRRHQADLAAPRGAVLRLEQVEQRSSSERWTGEQSLKPLLGWSCRLHVQRRSRRDDNHRRDAGQPHSVVPDCSSRRSPGAPPAPGPARGPRCGRGRLGLLPLRRGRADGPGDDRRGWRSRRRRRPRRPGASRRRRRPPPATPAERSTPALAVIDSWSSALVIGSAPPAAADGTEIRRPPMTPAAPRTPSSTARIARRRRARRPRR